MNDSESAREFFKMNGCSYQENEILCHMAALLVQEKLLHPEEYLHFLEVLREEG